MYVLWSGDALVAAKCLCVAVCHECMTKGVTCVPKFPLHSVSVQISLNRVGVHEKIVRLHIKITFVHNGKAKMK